MILDLSKRDNKWFNKEYCLETVKQNGYALLYVREQTTEICLEAVKQNGYALRFVREQTPELILTLFYHVRDLDINLVNITVDELNKFLKENPEWLLF